MLDSLGKSRSVLDDPFLSTTGAASPKEKIWTLIMHLINLEPLFLPSFTKRRARIELKTKGKDKIRQLYRESPLNARQFYGAGLTGELDAPIVIDVTYGT